MFFQGEWMTIIYDASVQPPQCSLKIKMIVIITIIIVIMTI